MKRALSLVLALVMALSLLACGQQQAETPAQNEAPAPQTQEQTPQPEPTPEPVAEPEPEGDAQLDEAVALGIIDAETALRADELALETEIPAMLQAAHVHGYGHESAYLAQMADYALKNQAASRYWFSMGIFYPYCEELRHAEVTDLKAFMEEMDQLVPEDLDWRFDSSNYGVIYNSPVFNMNPDREGLIQPGHAIWDLAFDVDDIVMGGPNRVHWHDVGSWLVPNMAFMLFDRVTGEKVLNMDENQMWRPAEKLTIGEAAKAALRYYRSFEEPAVKVAYADVGTYDKSIITDELLNKPTTLPANSCAHLPAEWHGVLFSKMEWVNTYAVGVGFDKIIRADDVQLAKDAGLNMIRLNLSFSYLQAPNVESGLVNETRLKQLDTVFALCMENDMHLQIACDQYQDFREDQNFEEAFTINQPGPQTDKEIADFAAFWGAIARRYADIPNEYLSFNLFNEALSANRLFTDEDNARIFGPAVEAIRAESPDRTIIADIHAANITGESMAKLGVALSYHPYIPYEFVAINTLDESMQNDPEYLHSVTWPFLSQRDYPGVVFDAKTVFDYTKSGMETTFNKMRAVAEQYGVGYMIGEFGIFGEYRQGFANYRYTDETLYSYYTDMLSTFEEEGIPWSLGIFDGAWGIITPYPSIEGVEYEKVGNYYVDVKMRDFFKSWAK